MKAIISNDADSGGTYLLGEFSIGYAALVGAIGEPTSDGDGYKVDAEWGITFDNGVVATIYNYKDGPNYNDGEGLVEDIRDWHIGGRDDRAVDLVRQLITGEIEIA